MIKWTYEPILGWKIEWINRYEKMCNFVFASYHKINSNFKSTVSSCKNDKT